MAAGFLILLLVAWVAFCVRTASKARSTGVVGSTDSFRRGLEQLGPDRHPEFVRTYGRLVPADEEPGAARRSFPRRSVRRIGPETAPAEPISFVAPGGETDSATARKREVAKPLRIRLGPLALFAALALGAVVTLMLALAGGPWDVHLAFDAALALYVSWLFEDQHRRAVQRRKVTVLPARSARRVATLERAAGVN